MYINQRLTSAIAAMIVAATWATFGQTVRDPLRFEVAAIKPVAPALDGRYMIRMRVNSGELNYTNASLKAMIQAACQVRAFQVSGPDWMASTRFDVVAKLPTGAPQSRVPEMLRSLLAERFGMKAHREARELPIYALMVGKSGDKMKASTEAEFTTGTTDGGSSAGDCGPTVMTTPTTGWTINKGPGHLEGHGMNMAAVANMLASFLGRAVVDQTGLSGTYDFDLQYASDERPPVAPGSPEPQVPSAGTPGNESLPLLSAIQSQLGLKLEATKGWVDVIVVDHVEKVPTEN